MIIQPKRPDRSRGRTWGYLSERRKRYCYCLDREARRQTAELAAR